MKEFALSIEVNPDHPIGQALASVIRREPKSELVGSLVNPFVNFGDSEDAGWRGEFWGKWALGVIESLPFSPPAKTKDLLRKSVRQIIETQQPDGYIGTYSNEHRWSGFDLWNTKYTMWALAAYGYTFQDGPAAHAASRLLEKVKALALSPSSKGVLGHSIEQLAGAGVASMLDPLHFMFTKLKLSSARDVAEVILAELAGEAPTTAALGGFFDDYWDEKPPISWPGAKAYELMATIEGVLKWASLLGNKGLVEKMLQRVRRIIDEEIFITGSGSSFELFSSARQREGSVILQPQETCVTVYWMRLCETAGNISDDPLFYSHLSRSIHNALLAAVDDDGSWWSYFCPLIGQSSPSHRQFDEISTSCCVSNGPRGLFSLARWAITFDQGELRLNVPIPGRYSFSPAEELPSEFLEVEVTQDASNPHLVHVRSTPERFIQSQIPRPGDDATHRVDETAGVLSVSPYSKNITLVSHPYRSDIWAMELGPYVFCLDSGSLPEEPHYLWRLDSMTFQSDGSLHTGRINVDFENRPSHYFNFTKRNLTFKPYHLLARESRRKQSNTCYRVWLEDPLVVTTFDACGEVPSTPKSITQLAKQ